MKFFLFLNSGIKKWEFFLKYFRISLKKWKLYGIITFYFSYILSVHIPYSFMKLYTLFIFPRKTYNMNFLSLLALYFSFLLVSNAAIDSRIIVPIVVTRVWEGDIFGMDVHPTWHSFIWWLSSCPEFQYKFEKRLFDFPEHSLEGER